MVPCNNHLCLLSSMACPDLEFIVPFKVNPPCQTISAGRCFFILRVWERPLRWEEGEGVKYFGYCILYQLCHAV